MYEERKKGFTGLIIGQNNKGPKGMYYFSGSDILKLATSYLAGTRKEFELE